MKKKTFNSFLILVISFFLIAVTANAETVESTIKYGETVDVSEKLGMSGQAIDSVIEVSKVNGDTGEEVLSYNCSGTTCTCQLKDIGLWHMSVHITVKYADGNVKTLNLRIVDFWPIRVYLGNFHIQTGPAPDYAMISSSWNYDSSKWESNYRGLTNSLTLTSKTRGQVVLPNVSDANTTSQFTGLPVKFIGFVKMQDVDQLTDEGSTMQVTMPVQKKGMCEKGGRVGDVAGAYGEFVAAGSTISGTGPYIYVSCYEYREVAFLSLAGGEFKSSPTGSWAFNDKINQYMTTSATTLPSADDISFPWGLTTQKRLIGWQSATGKYVTAANGPSTTIALDGDTWTAVFEYDAMGTGTNTDRMVRVGESTKIQSSNTTVLSCSASSGKVEASVDENGICIVKGLDKTDEGESVQVTVNYNGGETVVYNYVVLGSSTFDEDVVFEPEIQVIGIQNEELGDTDISFSSCASWVCDNLVSWGNNGTIPGSTLQQSAYYAEGTGGEGCDTSRQVGLCLDPGIYGPHGATYVRDHSMDTFMNSGAVQLVMNELATFLQNPSYKSDWNNGAATGAVADYRNGVNTAFRIITMSTDPRYSYSTSDCGTVSCNESMMFQRAGNALKSGSIEGALNYVYNANPDKNCHSGNPFGSSPYCVTKHYLEAYMIFWN